MLTTCDKRDGQAFAGGPHRFLADGYKPRKLWLLRAFICSIISRLCTCWYWATVDTNVSEMSGNGHVYTDMKFADDDVHYCWWHAQSRHSEDSQDTLGNCSGNGQWMLGLCGWEHHGLLVTRQYTCHFHSPHAPQLLALFIPPHSVAIQGWKKPSKMQLYRAGRVERTIDRHSNDYVTAFHLASRLSLTHSQALLTGTMCLCGFIECMSLNDAKKEKSGVSTAESYNRNMGLKIRRFPQKSGGWQPWYCLSEFVRGVLSESKEGRWDHGSREVMFTLVTLISYFSFLLPHYFAILGAANTSLFTIIITLIVAIFVHNWA